MLKFVRPTGSWHLNIIISHYEKTHFIGRVAVLFRSGIGADRQKNAVDHYNNRSKGKIDHDARPKRHDRHATVNQFEHV